MVQEGGHDQAFVDDVVEGVDGEDSKDAYAELEEFVGGDGGEHWGLG